MKKSSSRVFRTSLVLITSLLILNCQNDDNLIESTDQFRMNIQKLSYEKVKNDPQLNQLVELSKTDKFFNNIQSKSSSTESELSIIKESVNKIVHDDFISYTFLLDSKDSTNSYFENLLIEKKDDSITALIIRYEPSEEYLNSKNLPFSGKMTVRSVKYDASFLKSEMIECYWVDVFTPNYCTYHGYEGINNPVCWNYGEGPWNHSRTLLCTDSDGTDFGGDGGGGGSDGGDGGGDQYGSGGSSGGGSTTAPVYPCDDPIHGCDKEQTTHNLNIDQLNHAQREKLEEAVVDLEKDCFGKVLLQLLEPGVKIQMGSIGLGENGSYNPSTNTVKIAGDYNIGAGVLGAELMHAYQQQVYGNLVEITTSTNHVGGSNIEFEEKAFNISRENGQDFDDIEVGENGIGTGNPVGVNLETEELQNWLNELSFNHYSNTPIALSQNELNSWFSAMETFQEFHQGRGNGLYGTPIDYNLKPTAIVNLINRTKEIDC